MTIHRPTLFQGNLRQTNFFSVFVSLLCTLCFAHCGNKTPPKIAVVDSYDAQQTSPPAEEPLFDAVLPEYVESFDYVWQRIKDKHWDKSKVGDNWDALRKTLRPQIASADTATKARKVLQKMMVSLDQSHFAIFNDMAEDAVEDSPKKKAGVVGMSVQLLGSQLVVTRLVEKGPAQRAGVKRGWIVLPSSGSPLHTLLAQIKKKTTNKNQEGTNLLPPSPSKSFATSLSLADTQKVRRHIAKIFAGAAGSTSEFSFLNHKNKPVTLSITRQKPSGPAPIKFGYFPAIRVEYEAKPIANNIGYIRLSAFFDPPTVMTALKKDLTAFRKKRGIVLDLRGNPGGIGAMAMGIGGLFVTQNNLKLGTMQTRESSLHFVINPQPDPFIGKLAIVIDEHCASTCEILASGLQAIGRAKVFGMKSMGAALPSLFERLPTGETFQYAVANYTSVDGNVLEGNGVVPDHLVPLTRDSLLQHSGNQDSQITAAIRWIRQ